MWIGTQTSSNTSSKEEWRRAKRENLKYTEWILRDLKLLGRVEEELAFGNYGSPRWGFRETVRSGPWEEGYRELVLRSAEGLFAGFHPFIQHIFVEHLLCARGKQALPHAARVPAGAEAI